MSAEHVEIANNFTTYYYGLFCQNRAGLANLYVSQNKFLYILKCTLF